MVRAAQNHAKTNVHNALHITRQASKKVNKVHTCMSITGAGRTTAVMGASGAGKVGVVGFAHDAC
jgi:ABC-type lipoprotein export system ATPase subunit